MTGKPHYLTIEVFFHDRDSLVCSFHVLVDGIALLVESELMKAGDNPYLMYPINDLAAEMLENLGVLVDRQRFVYHLTSKPAPEEWHSIIANGPT